MSFRSFFFKVVPLLFPTDTRPRRLAVKESIMDKGVSAKVFNTEYVGTYLLDFPVSPRSMSNGKDFQSLLDSVKERCAKAMKLNGPFEELYSGKIPLRRPTGPDDESNEDKSETTRQIILLAGDRGTSMTIRVYPDRYPAKVTVTLEYDIMGYEDRKPPMSWDAVVELEASMRDLFGDRKKTSSIPQVKRGLNYDIYFTTSDDRLLEYDIKEIVFDGRSEFQHVQISRTANYGNMLVLDGLVNLAESDLSYTEALMCRGKIDYTGKTILILGGGDGALLNELRKEGAKSILMIDIDEMVMQACQKYLRQACGDSLDQRKHENYEIITGDCIQYMKNYRDHGDRFDFVFGDLTDIPITSKHGQLWDFFRTTLQLSFSILGEGGTYLTHANGISATENLDIYENTIREGLGFDVAVTRSSAFVPSFKEKWVFFQVKRA